MPGISQAGTERDCESGNKCKNQAETPVIFMPVMTRCAQRLHERKELPSQ